MGDTRCCALPAVNWWNLASRAAEPSPLEEKNTCEVAVQKDMNSHVFSEGCEQPDRYRGLSIGRLFLRGVDSHVLTDGCEHLVGAEECEKPLSTKEYEQPY